MADCSYARCVQERRFIKRELLKWNKDMVYVVGKFFFLLIFFPNKFLIIFTLNVFWKKKNIDKVITEKKNVVQWDRLSKQPLEIFVEKSHFKRRNQQKKRGNSFHCWSKTSYIVIYLYQIDFKYKERKKEKKN